MARKPAGSEQDDDELRLSDEELGVGVEDDAGVKIAAAMADPVIAAAIEQHIQAQVAALIASRAGDAPMPQSTDFLAAMTALGKQIADSINRSTAATIEQMPGHVKPIPVEEAEARAAAWIEMETLARDATNQYWELIQANDHAGAERLSPTYLLKQDWFGPGEVGSEMYVEGMTVRWFGPPGTFMEPRNALATKIADAMWRYLGNEGAPSAEDIAAYASGMNRPSTPGANIPEMPQLISSQKRGTPGATVVTEAGITDVGPAHTIGTVVKVLKGGFGSEPRVIQGVGV